MCRGRQIERECDRAEACANCAELRFLRYRSMDCYGIHGMWFCRVAYNDTGDFASQPWDFTCDDFRPRGRRHHKNKTVLSDAVPIVEAKEAWERELVS